METDISVERAVELIKKSVNILGSESISVLQAHGCVLAENIYAPINQPPFPRSPLDGYALHYTDSVDADIKNPVTLKVVGKVLAGNWLDKEVYEGQAVRIMTGAPIPKGCDCVIMQEDTDYCADEVKIYRELKQWQNYCFEGEDFRKGDVLLKEGTRLTGNAVGVLAAAGMYRSDVVISVRKRVKCAVICTGDELVSNDVSRLSQGKIYSSNSAVLSSRLDELGIEMVYLNDSFGDNADRLAEIIREVSEAADVIITTGGVSVGIKDILPETVSLLGAERIFHGVKLKPGSPLMFSVYNNVPVLSLSGNPFAASATFELFARPLFSALLGTDDLLPQIFNAVLDTPFNKKSVYPRYVRGIFRNGHVILPQGHSSGQIKSAAGTNCLVELLGEPVSAGSSVKVHLL